jgi:hypothetical protein
MATTGGEAAFVLSTDIRLGAAAGDLVVDAAMAGKYELPPELLFGETAGDAVLTGLKGTGLLEISRVRMGFCPEPDACCGAAGKGCWSPFP